MMRGQQNVKTRGSLGNDLIRVFSPFHSREVSQDESRNILPTA
jgi:hypothetical protein